MKRCSRCGDPKPLSEFHKRTLSKDGHRAACKKCRAKESAKRQSEDGSRKRRYQKLRYHAANRGENISNNTSATHNRTQYYIGISNRTLGPAQKKVLDVIKAHNEMAGYTPSTRYVARQLNRNQSCIHNSFINLEVKGYLVRHGSEEQSFLCPYCNGILRRNKNAQTVADI